MSKHLTRKKKKDFGSIKKKQKKKKHLISSFVCKHSENVALLKQLVSFENIDFFAYHFREGLLLII